MGLTILVHELDVNNKVINSVFQIICANYKARRARITVQNCYFRIYSLSSSHPRTFSILPKLSICNIWPKKPERNIQESTFLDQVTDFRRLFNFSPTNIYMTNQKPDKHFGAEQGKVSRKTLNFHSNDWTKLHSYADIA